MMGPGIEAGLAGLRQHPQTFRLWSRNLRFRHLLQRWEDWQALNASRTLGEPLLASRRGPLEKEWSEIVAFFARYETNRTRLAALREKGERTRALPLADGCALPTSVLQELDREWARLEKDPCFSGDPGFFEGFEDGLAVAEEQLQRLDAEQNSREAASMPAGEATAASPGDPRGEAQRLLREGMVLAEPLDLNEETRDAIRQDRRNILALLENGESVCAFWWAKDLHAWLWSVTKTQLPSSLPSSVTTPAEFTQRHRRFLAIQRKVAKLIQG